MAHNIHVSYDLNSPGQNYDRVIAKIKTLGSWAKIHKSYWYLDTALSAEQVARAIWSSMDATDSLYVVDATTNYAMGFNLPPDTYNFIRARWVLHAA